MNYPFSDVKGYELHAERISYPMSKVLAVIMAGGQGERSTLRHIHGRVTAGRRTQPEYGAASGPRER